MKGGREEVELVNLNYEIKTKENDHPFKKCVVEKVLISKSVSSISLSFRTAKLSYGILMKRK